MLFKIIKRFNIRIGGWQKEQSRQSIIWKLRTQHTLGMLPFVEQLFAALCNTKTAHYLLDVGDKFGESPSSACYLQISRIWQGITWTYNLRNCKYKWILCTVVMLPLSQSISKDKILKLVWRTTWIGLKRLFRPVCKGLRTLVVKYLRNNKNYNNSKFRLFWIFLV